MRYDLRTGAVTGPHQSSRHCCTLPRRVGRRAGPGRRDAERGRRRQPASARDHPAGSDDAGHPPPPAPAGLPAWRSGSTTTARCWSPPTTSTTTWSCGTPAPAQRRWQIDIGYPERSGHRVLPERAHAGRRHIRRRGGAARHRHRPGAGPAHPAVLSAQIWSADFTPDGAWSRSAATTARCTCSPETPCTRSASCRSAPAPPGLSPPTTRRLGLSAVDERGHDRAVGRPAAVLDPSRLRHRGRDLTPPSGTPTSPACPTSAPAPQAESGTSAEPQPYPSPPGRASPRQQSRCEGDMNRPWVMSKDLMRRQWKSRRSRRPVTPGNARRHSAGRVVGSRTGSDNVGPAPPTDGGPHHGPAPASPAPATPPGQRQ